MVDITLDRADDAIAPDGGGTHVARIVRMIEADILSGDLAPGVHLSEHGLAERFKVSRTPIREAIRELAACGLVSVKPRRGAFVARVPAQDLIEMFEYMAELEALAAKFAARRMTVDEKLKLREVHESYRHLVGDDNREAYFEASGAFHRAIFEGAKNRPLTEAASALYGRLLPYRRRQMDFTGRSDRSFAEHEAVLCAVVDGDAELAERAMRGHAGVVGDNVMDFIAAIAKL